MSRLSTAMPRVNFGVSNKFWISLGVALWLYVVISQIPAVWGGFLLTRSGDLALSGVSGSIWSGRASLASVKYKSLDHSLGQVTWKIQPLSFFTLKPCAFVTTQMDNQQFEGRVCIAGRKALELRDVNANLPAGLFLQVLPLAIDGQFSITSDKVRIQDGLPPVGNIKVSWSGAKIYNGGNWMNLGNVAADLVGSEQTGVSGHVFDVASPMHIDMVTSGLLTKAVSVKGSVSMPEAYFREINASAWLSMFATAQPNDAQGNIVYSLDLNF